MSTNYTYTNTTGTYYTAGSPGQVLTTGIGGGTWAVNPVTVTPSATIQLEGKDADVVINGESLKETLQAIKEALRIPTKIERDDRLEKDFEEIRELREKYERKVQEYKEQQRAWSILKD